MNCFALLLQLDDKKHAKCFEIEIFIFFKKNIFYFK